MSLPPLDKYLQAFLETLLMAGASSLIAIVAGLALAIVLHTTAPGGLYARPRLYRGLSAAVNIGRAIPFIILLVALLPVTRAIVGTTLGTWAAVVPLSANLIPFFARIAQVSLGEVDGGLVEAARAMGLRRPQIVRQVLLPEALPGLIAAATVTAIALVGYTAMAGVVGAGGLGDLAVRFGYQRFQTDVMIVTVVLMLVLVQALQMAGDAVVRRVSHR